MRPQRKVAVANAVKMTASQSKKRVEGAVLARHIQKLRRAAGLTLQQLSDRSGLAPSTISKIENNTVSPTYGILIRLASGFGMDVAELLTFEKSSGSGRRAVTRKGEGCVYSIGTHEYELLCTEISNRKMTPMIARIRAHTLDETLGLNSHRGEEVMFVVSGEVVLYTEHYAPLFLHPGDCVYLDSTMGHVAVAGGTEDSIVFWVCSDTRDAWMLKSEQALESAG